MASIFVTAEQALIARQKLPEYFGANKVRPSYDGLGLANIAALPIHWLCPEAPTSSEQPALPPFNPNLLRIDTITQAWENWLSRAPINHVVLLILDAFGYDQLLSLITNNVVPGLANAIKSDKAFFIPATTVFPSTTVTALTSSTTAYATAQHGVTSTTAYLREIGALVSLLRWCPHTAPTSASYPDEQLNPDTFVTVPNIYLRMEKAGINVGIVNYYRFKNTSISRYTTVGSEAGKDKYTPYLTYADGFAQLRDRILTSYNTDKSFTYIYVPNIDSAAHRYAPLNPYYQAEVATIDFALKRELLDPLSGRGNAVLLITADHGQCPTDLEKVLWLHEHPDLTKLLWTPAVTGEARARFLHVKKGAEESVKAYVKSHFDQNFLLVSKAEAIALGLFGLPNQPLSQESDDRVGDFILVPRQDWICYQSLSGERWTPNAGGHGGLSRAEMLIPFLAYRF
ncbi:MAG: alkaline phosphatase family protein [Calothrix sp. C42_A2020_038]|nr:alkaline phosphatase family protein [Calothrix sp. C42_A2020_038]